MRLIVRPEAEADIAAAFAWYERKHAGLGHRFIRELERVVDSISGEPLRFAPAGRTARRALLRRFPYAVLFVARESTVTVLAVMHMARKPGLWTSRASGEDAPPED